VSRSRESVKLWYRLWNNQCVKQHAYLLKPGLIAVDWLRFNTLLVLMDNPCSIVMAETPSRRVTFTAGRHGESLNENDTCKVDIHGAVHKVAWLGYYLLSLIGLPARFFYTMCHMLLSVLFHSLCPSHFNIIVHQSMQIIKQCHSSLWACFFTVFSARPTPSYTLASHCLVHVIMCLCTLAYLCVIVALF